MTLTTKSVLGVSAALLVCLGASAFYSPVAEAAPPQHAQPSPQQRAAQLKAWLKASQSQMRDYEWIERTVISKGGEEKKHIVKRCYYDVNGKIEKVVLDQSAEKEGGPPGILPLGRLIKKAEEHEKDELVEYMHQAEALIHKYVPPVPGLIQQSINAGKMGMQLLEPGRRERLNFGDYLKPGDSLGVEIEMPTNRLLAIAVTSYLDSHDDAVSLDVTMSVLPDGTMYAEKTSLDAKAKGVNVTITNSGYKRIAR